MLRNSLITSMSLIAAVCVASLQAERAPKPGHTVNATVLRVIDGDTIEVEVKQRLRIRLLDCWAPERKHPDGPASTANLKRLLTDPDVTLHIPMTADVAKSLTFGRFLGTVWSKADADLSVNQLQVRDGFASVEKRK